jgi:hypothetical protein
MLLYDEKPPSSKGDRRGDTHYTTISDLESG